MNATNIKCGNPDCEVAETGECFEGVKPPESCSYYNQDVVQPPKADKESEGLSSEAHQGAILFSGEALSTEEADAFIRKKSATFVAVVGDTGIGKTTLISSLYGQFLKGPFANCIFSGSDSLIGFERICHRSRLDSEMLVPDTTRTSLQEDLKFYHLAITDAGQERIELLISDRAGEVYKSARSDTSELDSLVEIKKADFTVLLLDGESLVDQEKRTGAFQSVKKTLRAMLDGSLLTDNDNVQIVISKSDVIEKYAQKDELLRQIEAFCDGLSEKYSERLGSLDFSHVSARDPEGKIPTGSGLETLFSKWIKPRKMTWQPASDPEEVRSERDRLVARTDIEAK